MIIDSENATEPARHHRLTMYLTTTMSFLITVGFKRGSSGRNDFFFFPSWILATEKESCLSLKVKGSVQLLKRKVTYPVGRHMNHCQNIFVPMKWTQLNKVYFPNLECKPFGNLKYPGAVRLGFPGLCFGQVGQSEQAFFCGFANISPLVLTQKPYHFIHRPLVQSMYSRH